LILIINFAILVDSGYGLKEWLIPPLNRNPEDASERRFNRAHKSTRRVIENSFGILRERFPCLNYLRVDPIFAGKIVMACVALHNICSKEDYTWSRFEPEDQTFNLHGNYDDEPPTPAAEARVEQLLNYFGEE